MNRFSMVNRKAWLACFVDDARRVALEVNNKVFCCELADFIELL